MQVTLVGLFVLWAILEFVMFARFLISGWRLLDLLQSHHSQRWVFLTTFEHFGWGPGIFVWKKYRRFLRDDWDDLGDNEVRILKQRACLSNRRLLLCSTIGPLVLVVLFVTMMLGNIANW